jgi:hypothetical protein
VVSLHVGLDGKLQVQNDVNDYQLRGVELENYSYLDFRIQTYETKRTSRNHAERDDDDERDEEHVDLPQTHRGRPANLRSNYLEDHPKHETHCRVVRCKGHNTLPSIVGPFFPRRDNPEQRQYYCASMLALLSPWRQLDELKAEESTWEELFKEFVAGASQETINVLEGIQYHYDCRSASEREERDDGNVNSNFTREVNNLREGPSEDVDKETDDEAVIAQYLLQ